MRCFQADSILYLATSERAEVVHLGCQLRDGLVGRLEATINNVDAVRVWQEMLEER